jgi:hypothetical protein
MTPVRGKWEWVLQFLNTLSELGREPLDLQLVKIAAIWRRVLLLFHHNCAG